MNKIIKLTIIYGTRTLKVLDTLKNNPTVIELEIRKIKKP
jgi:hypothetical protein